MILIIIAGSAAFASLCICIASIYKKDTQKSIYFNLLALAVTFYLIGNFFEVTSQSVEAALVGVKISYLGVPFIPPLWYLCVRQFCGQRVENPLRILGILFIPVIIVILAYTWQSNHLLFTDFYYQSDKQTSQLYFVEGPLYILKQLYLYFFNALGIITIVIHYMKGTQRFRQQAIFFLISAFIPVFNTATFQVNIASYWIDITPIGLSLTMILFFMSLRKYGIENFSSILKGSVIENLHEGVLLFDRYGIYMDSNKVIKEIFPEIKNISVGTSINEMSYLPFETSVLFDDAESNLKEFTREYQGRIKTYSLSVSHVRQKEAVLGHSVIIYNITPYKSLVNELEIKAHIDPLTGIFNRGFFFEKGLQESEQAKRARYPLSLIMFDLDFFKNINDTHGHVYGDYVLRKVAMTVLQNLRETDIFGRYGGEEFCILLPHANASAARAKADRVRQKVGSYLFDNDGIRATVTASFGVSELNIDSADDTIEQLLKRADENLYKAKANGRDRVE